MLQKDYRESEEGALVFSSIFRALHSYRKVVRIIAANKAVKVTYDCNAVASQ